MPLNWTNFSGHSYTLQNKMLNVEKKGVSWTISKYSIIRLVAVISTKTTSVIWQPKDSTLRIPLNTTPWLTIHTTVVITVDVMQTAGRTSAGPNRCSCASAPEVRGPVSAAFCRPRPRRAPRSLGSPAPPWDPSCHALRGQKKGLQHLHGPAPLSLWNYTCPPEFLLHDRLKDFAQRAAYVHFLKTFTQNLLFLIRITIVYLIRFHTENCQKYLYFRNKLTFIRTRYRQNQHLWCHFGDKMSPGN
jgi:hypothetical protein